MRIRALVSFSGLISMGKGQVMECNNEVALQDLLKVGYVEEINSKEDPTKAPTGAPEEPTGAPEEPTGAPEEPTGAPEEPVATLAAEPVEEANEEKGVDSRETKRNNKK